MFLKKVWDSVERVPITYKGINLNESEEKLILTLVHRTLIRDFNRKFKFYTWWEIEARMVTYHCNTNIQDAETGGWGKI